MAPEHRRLNRYQTMTLEEIASLPVSKMAGDRAHLYLWVPNALLAEALHVMNSWGFPIQIQHRLAENQKRWPIRWARGWVLLPQCHRACAIRCSGKGRSRTLKPGRTQVNYIESRKREHSRKPDELYGIIEKCSWSRSWSFFLVGLDRAGLHGVISLKNIQLSGRPIVITARN